MVIRIRLGKGLRISSRRETGRRLALTSAALLTPAAVMASALGFWSIAADLKWTNSFAISNGVFSHWQIWMGAAVLLETCSRVLHRYGRGVLSGASRAR